MKRITIRCAILSICMSAIFLSCSKDAAQDVKSNKNQSASTVPVNNGTPEAPGIAPGGPTPPGYGGSSATGYGVYQVGSIFQSSFAGGIKFSSFPSPLTYNTSGGVILFNPAYNGLEASGSAHILSINQAGPYITITVSSLTTSLSLDTYNQLHTYNIQMNNFLTHAVDPVTHALIQPNPPTLPAAANSNGYITYTGTFIIDPNVPVTHVSIANGILVQTGIPAV